MSGGGKWGKLGSISGNNKIQISIMKILLVLSCSMVIASAFSQLVVFSTEESPKIHIERNGDISWNRQKLDEIIEYLNEIGATTFLLVTGGNVVLSHGNVEIPYDVHSIRKALLSAIVGQHLGEGSNRINLESTLEELGINDHPNPLTKSQQKAKVIHLIKSISGINHKAAGEFEGWQNDKDKILGTGPNIPGTIWAYNNWDYNALTTIFEQVTELSVYEAFKAGLADPLDMQDFNEDSIYLSGDSSLSVHKKAGFFMSARDLSKLGQLYLNKGIWEGKQLIPSPWIERITNDYVKTNEPGMKSGHGYLWWVPDDSICTQLGIPTGCYYASGFGRQRLFIIPKWRTVTVHQVNTEHYDDCFTEWATSNQLNVSSLEEATNKIFTNFLIHLIKCRKLGYPEENQFYKKCNFVSGSEFERLLQKISKAIN